jgi:hypothetical protein
MTWTRLFLVVIGLLFTTMGAWALLAPAAAAGAVGLVMASPTGSVAFMALFGGFNLGYGAFLVWSAVRKAYLPAGLLSLVFGLGAAAGARALGMMTQGTVQPVAGQFLAFEIGSAILAALFLRYVLRQVRIG